MSVAFLSAQRSKDPNKQARTAGGGEEEGNWRPPWVAVTPFFPSAARIIRDAVLRCCRSGHAS